MQVNVAFDERRIEEHILLDGKPNELCRDAFDNKLLGTVTQYLKCPWWCSCVIVTHPASIVTRFWGIYNPQYVLVDAQSLHTDYST